MKEKVSIIIPVYNAKKHLRETIKSVINQTYRNIEIICVDDGSTDNSLMILNEYAEQDSRISVYHQQNKYAGAARNYGIDKADGKWLMFLDADDIFDKNMVEYSVECAKKNDVDIVVFGGKYFDNDINDAWHHDALLRESMIPEGDCFESAKNYNVIFNFTTPAPWNKLYKKEFIKKYNIRFQECKRFNDAYFVELSLGLSQRIGLVRKDLVYYRTNNSNSLQGNNDDTPLLCIDVYRELQKRLKNEPFFYEIADSFKNLALSNFIYVLDSVINEESFIKIYEELKNRAFKEFEIIDSDENIYTFKYAYNQYKKILTSSPLQFLLERQREKNDTVIHLFPFGKVKKKKKLVIYGAGVVGDDYIKQLEKSDFCEEYAWADKKIRSKNGIRVYAPKEVEWIKYDYVVIAVESKHTMEEIVQELKCDYNVKEGVIVWWDSRL